MKQKTFISVTFVMVMLVAAGCSDMINGMHKKSNGLTLQFANFSGIIVSDVNNRLEDLDIQLLWNGKDTGFRPTDITENNEGGVITYTYTFTHVPQRSGYVVQAQARKHDEGKTTAFSLTDKTEEERSLDLTLGKQWQVTTLASGAGTRGIALDSMSDTLYVVDFDNNSIRSVSTSTGNTQTLPSAPGGGNIITGPITIVWGNSPPNTPPDNTPFQNPNGLAFDPNDNSLYVAETTHYRILKLNSDGTMETLAGNGTGGWQDGTGAEVKFNSPAGLALDPVNNILYVADSANNRIRKILLSLNPVETQTLAGDGTEGSRNGSYSDAQFNSPAGLALDQVNGILYVADTGNNCIRTVSTSTGNTQTLTATPVPVGDETAGTARLTSPNGLALDQVNGILYVTESNRVRKIDIAARTVRTIVGSEANSTTADGTGREASFSTIGGIVFDLEGDCYVSELASSTIRKMTRNW